MKKKLKDLVCDLKGINRCLILQAKITGAWLNVCGTIVSGTVLSATEFWDFLCAGYNVSPQNLQSHCDRCGTVFGVKHKLSCNTGGLVIVRHNKIHEKILYLSLHAFTLAYVCSKPLIHQGRTRSKQDICQVSENYK